MILVDDHVARSALGGYRSASWGNETPVLTWTMHMRLVRAVLDSSTTGRLSRETREDMVAVVAAPPEEILQILDPRPFTVPAARAPNPPHPDSDTVRLFVRTCHRTVTQPTIPTPHLAQ